MIPKLQTINAAQLQKMSDEEIKKLDLKGRYDMKPTDYLKKENIRNYLCKSLGRRSFRKLVHAIEADREIIVSGISGVVTGKTTLVNVLKKMGCKVKEEPDTFLLYLENAVHDGIPNLIEQLFDESKEGEADGTGKEL